MNGGDAIRLICRCASCCRSAHWLTSAGGSQPSHESPALLPNASKAAANPRKTLIRSSAQRKVRDLGRIDVQTFELWHLRVELVRGTCD
jgi:hypothetical protein